jgi:hypothetical protein
MGMKIPIDWLLEGEPYIAYRTRLDLLGQGEDNPSVQAARAEMLTDPKIQAIVKEISVWPWKVISSHKSAGQAFHKLTFLADLGIRADDTGMDAIIGPILDRRAEEGPFQLPINVPKHFGGTGTDQLAWALCDTPLLLYSLAKMGLQSDPAVQKAAGYLAELVRQNGWPCAVSKELGKFRGPGRKEDPCPFATLAMLKALGIMDNWRDSYACHSGTETLLHLWSTSLNEHPYIFFMGTDFRKLKVPFIWYDLLHALEVLSHFSWVKNDPRYLEMLSLLQRKADAEGRFTVESAWLAWKDWEFGQKKIPSRWLTLLSIRVLQRQNEMQGFQYIS